MIVFVILGLIQGVAEWLPVSSEGLLVLAQRHFWPDASMQDILSTALFLHLGTVSAAVVYFRRELTGVLTAAWHTIRRQSVREADQRLLSYLTVTTVISGGLGLGLLWVLNDRHASASHRTSFIEALIGFGLLITGVLLLVSRQSGRRREDHITWADMIVLGLVQGCAALPGLSRSGLTVSALLLRGFEKTTAIRMSFLMSIPLVLLGQVGLHLTGWRVSPQALLACATAFASGLLTIHLFLKLAKEIPFGWLVMLMGGLMLLNVWLVPSP